MLTQKIHSSICVAYLENSGELSGIKALLESISEDEQIKIIRDCSDSFLTPLLGSLVSREVPSKFEDSTLLKASKEIYQANIKYQNIYECALDEFLSLLNKEGLTPVLLKGASYIKTGLYLPGERVTSDIDVWINPADLNTVLSILKDNGYLQITNFADPISTDSWYEFNPIDPTDFRNSPAYISHHLPRIISPTYKIPLEIHITVVSGTGDSASWLASNVDQNMSLRDSGGIRYFIPSLTFELMHCFYHSSVVHRSSGTDYRHLVDFRRLLQRAVNDYDDSGSVQQILSVVKLITDQLKLSHEFSSFLGSLQFVSSHESHTDIVDILTPIESTGKWGLIIQRLQIGFKKQFKKFRIIFFRTYGPVPLYVAFYKYFRYRVFRLLFGNPHRYSLNAQFVRRYFRKNHE